jgi:TetR/AcrR family transcriptional repressor of nem operon
LFKKDTGHEGDNNKNGESRTPHFPRAQLRGLLEEAQTIGEVDPGLDAKDAAAFLIDCYEGTLVRMKVDGDRNSFRRFRRLALASLAVDKRSQAALSD